MKGEIIRAGRSNFIIYFRCTFEISSDDKILNIWIHLHRLQMLERNKMEEDVGDTMYNACANILAGQFSDFTTVYYFLLSSKIYW